MWSTQLIGYKPVPGDGGAFVTGFSNDSYDSGSDSDRENWDVAIGTNEDQTKIRKYYSIPSNYTKMDFSIKSQFDASRPASGVGGSDNYSCWFGPTTQNTDVDQYWNLGDDTHKEKGMWKNYNPGDTVDKVFEEPDDYPRKFEYLMYARDNKVKDDLHIQDNY